MRGRWSKQGEEPTLETFFEDPIVDLLLQRDGLTQTDVWQAIDKARPGFRNCRLETRPCKGVPQSLSAGSVECSLRF